MLTTNKKSCYTENVVRYGSILLLYKYERTDVMSSINASTSHDTLGIDKDRINDSIQDIKDSIEAIRAGFVELEKIVEDSKNYMVGSEGESFRNKAASIMSNFPVVENNLNTYIEDLTNFINNYVAFESSYTMSEVK